MSDLVFVLVIFLVLAGVGLGVAVAALLMLRVGERKLAAMQAEQDTKLAAAEVRITAAAVEKALGMVKDIVGNKAAPDTALNRFEAAVKAEAEHTAWVRRMELDRAQANVLLDNKGVTK